MSYSDEKKKKTLDNDHCKAIFTTYESSASSTSKPQLLSFHNHYDHLVTYHEGIK